MGDDKEQTTDEIRALIRNAEKTGHNVKVCAVCNRIESTEFMAFNLKKKQHTCVDCIEDDDYHKWRASRGRKEYSKRKEEKK